MKYHHWIVWSAIGLAQTAVWAHDATHNHTPTTASAKAPEQTPWGIAANPKAVQRTITIRMDDAMRFTPAHIDVHEGETVRIRAENKGKVLHEIVLGTPETLKEHADMMRQHPDMAHDAPSMAHVAAGKKGDVVWTFNRPGTFQFACLVAGHFEAGMTGTITVHTKNATHQH